MKKYKYDVYLNSDIILTTGTMHSIVTVQIQADSRRDADIMMQGFLGNISHVEEHDETYGEPNANK